ncbi:MAG: aminoacyl-histidine dipeptidase [Firmicutes bacterium]|nr:aminoacyl-histidine dipeptidase [Bacillota bacterium]
MKNLNCSRVLHYFEEINKIPRGSGNEKAVSDYLMAFAKEKGLLAHQDKANNVIIKKAASNGMESFRPVCIQGHMDMVCEKNADVEHDFTKDPIKVIYDGEYIHAGGTTLGADDGIAVAMALALLEDDDLPHPALEVLITTDEEVGMLGAAAFDPKLISARLLLNIDSEIEGVFTVGCAGGVKTHSHIPVEYEKNTAPAYLVSISGLQGGHSGIEIHKERGNANKLILRIYDMLKADFSDLAIAEVFGGAKDNAIPRTAEMVLATSAPFEDISEHIKIIEKTFLNELNGKDEVKISIEKTSAGRVFTAESAERLSTFAALVPNGVQSNNLALGMPEVSNNLGVIRQNEDDVEFICALRSSTASLKTELFGRVKKLTEVCGGRLDFIGDYPAWEFKNESPLRDIFVSEYKKMYGKDPVVETVHAGLECGLIGEKIPDMDMISFGPNLLDIHTPKERAEIMSIERVWNFLTAVLKKGI